MDTTIAQIVISAISGGLVSIILLFIYAVRYIEKIDQLEKCDLNGRLSKLERKTISTFYYPFALFNKSSINSSGYSTSKKANPL